MAEIADFGKPSWLSAYPNDGTLDYFGYRFYRQPLRALLVRGAAANDFKNAKTLIYYAAIAYGFRKENKINLDAELNEDQMLLWKDWYKVANYIYIVNYYSKHGEVPDRGFTGANEESKKYFNNFYNGTEKNFDVRSCYSRIYPEQRQWGYLTQFWRPPLDYFRCVLDITQCTQGEYAEECYLLLSSYPSWKKFVKILVSGTLNRSDLNEIQEIIDSKKLNSDEKKLAKKIIFDEMNITQGENDEYKKAFYLLTNLKENGLEGYLPKTKEDYTMVFTYAHLTNKTLGQNDSAWKILISSIVFEMGLNRLYTFILGSSTHGVISVTSLKKQIKHSVSEWLSKNKFGDSPTLTQTCNEWSKKHIRDISSYQNIFDKMLIEQDLETYIDGLLQGYLISKTQTDNDFLHSEDYHILTNKYHYFVPQPFFENKKIDESISFINFVEKMVFWILDDQFKFSLDRMNLGQKAKFIMSKSEFKDQYIFQVDEVWFGENRGIIEMIDACICLWKTAGVF